VNSGLARGCPAWTVQGLGYSRQTVDGDSVLFVRDKLIVMEPLVQGAMTWVRDMTKSGR